MDKSHLEATVRQLVARYCDRQIDFSHFHEQFVAATWDAELSEQSSATQIELRIAEHTSGHWTEDELRELLC